MKKIGFVVPWFDDNIPGGAEMEMREVSSHLKNKGADIEILTTCVKDFNADWSINHFSTGESISANGIKIRRFKARKRNTRAFDKINLKLINKQSVTLEEEDIFLQEMVNSPELYEYIRTHSEEYAVFVYIPYMFGTTYYGVKACPEKAVLIPCFHDESYAYFRRFKEVFPESAGMVFNAKPEAELAEKIYQFSRSNTKTIVMGIGMDTDIKSFPDDFRKKFRIEKPFILYAGRKDTGKNVHTLLKYFSEYKKRMNNDIKLVLIGGGNIDIPADVQNDVYDLGFVDVQDKYNACGASLLMCQPSENESFSLVIMESWLCGRPVLVNQNCAVTKNFVLESNGGLYFSNYFEFEGCVNYIISHPDTACLMGDNGKNYVNSNFSWDIITEKYLEFFREIAGE